MNITIIKGVTKLGVGFIASCGVDKIIKLAIEHITPDRALTAYEKVIIGIGSFSVNLALSGIVANEIDRDIDFLFDIPNKIEKAKEIPEFNIDDIRNDMKETIDTNYTVITSTSNEE